jgi:thiol-disulfide isomerase/thioredoxin
VRPLVACLCAEWCGSCREYRAVFVELSARHGERADFAWIDVEDESDALGDPDIENFPTLLIATDDRALFYGAVTPASAERLVAGAVDGSLAPSVAADATPLLARVRHLLDGRSGDGDPA